MIELTRLEKCEAAVKAGYTYDKETGIVIGLRGKQIKGKDSGGYYHIKGSTRFEGVLPVHHFAWYCVYGNVDFIMLDHDNEIKNDNRIVNLRISNSSLNQLNISASKGYSFDKNKNLYNMQIVLDGVKTQKYFNTAEEAREVYLQLKKEHMEKHYGTN